ncbi:diphthine--ammonia ligase [Nitrosopumilus sp.]|uniref:diphthine--ammonia ligase n=1 Tax=Nitrosopumilus sp. TaxID=2024843 RepID=UPI002602F823|nr:diphthine--ammonia ligase [Nitrosopumilus sp.]
MKIASLFSGGKDSAFAIHLMQKQSYEVAVLLTIFPKSPESHLLHHPNMKWTKLQAESMKIPQLTIESNSDATKDELLQIENLLITAKDTFNIEGIVHGGIKSNFQKEKFESICQKLGLKVFTPLWHLDAEKYMNDLLENNFSFIMTSVTSEGLDESWLGKKISNSDLSILKNLSDKYGFNLNFEGGEAETFVVNCPLFSSSIEITKFEKNWDGYRGRFEIVEAGLNYNA